MKYMFASDVHGSAYYCRKMLEAYDKEKAERLVLLGKPVKQALPGYTRPDKNRLPLSSIEC